MGIFLFFIVFLTKNFFIGTKQVGIKSKTLQHIKISDTPIKKELSKSANKALPSNLPKSVSDLSQSQDKQIPKLVSITKDIKKISNIIILIYFLSGKILIIKL